MDEENGAGAALSAGIEAEFHDTTLHHSLHINNTPGFTMADLSLTALMLATTVSQMLFLLSVYSPMWQE